MNRIGRIICERFEDFQGIAQKQNDREMRIEISHHELSSHEHVALNLLDFIINFPTFPEILEISAEEHRVDGL